MFKKLYLLLFSQVSAAIEALEQGNAALARTILIRAQQNAEELYLEGTEE